MSWLHPNSKATNGRDHASVSEVLACFKNEKDLLFRLAFLITGDAATAEQSVVHACDTTVQGHSPFRDWLTEWAKSVTVTSAISRNIPAIRNCEPAYKDLRCTHSEHLSPGSNTERERAMHLVLQIDPSIIIAELDPMARAVLVLRTAIRTSIQDCTVRLNVSRSAVLGANCRAMTWLGDVQRQGAPGDEAAASTEIPSASDHSSHGGL